MYTAVVIPPSRRTDAFICPTPRTTSPTAVPKRKEVAELVDPTKRITGEEIMVAMRNLASSERGQGKQGRYELHDLASRAHRENLLTRAEVTELVTLGKARDPGAPWIKRLTAF